MDATNGSDLVVELDPLPTNLPPSQRIHGRVVDEDSQPVFGAVVSIQGALQDDRNWWGRVPNVDKAAVTAADGTFLLTSTEDYQAWRLCVNATGFVESNTELLKTGDTQHQLALDPGSFVSGTITKDGKPAASVTLGICQTNRGSDQFAGEYVIATDEHGRFLFTSVVADETMTIYSKMEKGNLLATEIAEFTSGNSGASVELGEFELRPAKTLSGKLVLVDAGPFPKNFRILVNREYAWDSQTIDVDENGYFQAKGLPMDEAINISVRLAGYSIDHSKTNLQVTGLTSAAVFTDSDSELDTINIVLKPDK